MRPGARRVAVLVVAGATGLAGCARDAAIGPKTEHLPSATASGRAVAVPRDGPAVAVPRDATTSPQHHAEEPAVVRERRPKAAAEPVVGDGRPRRSALSIPALGLHDLPVLPYRGRTDDRLGTAIQDRGVAASPHGSRGGVGPGGAGNYLITAHRTSSTAPFADLPSLRRGHRVIVRVGHLRHIYEVRRTRQTSFRSKRSLAEQRAAVPGRPGTAPSGAYLTLSTCATPEDHAAGNYWSDRFHNPEHRIDKIAVLVRTVRATG